MRKNAPWLVVVALCVLIVLMATDTVTIKCDSDELDVPEAVEDAGENVEDAAEELTEG
jgi:hypothetical protein